MKKTKSRVFLERLFSTLLLWGIVTWMFMSQSPWVFCGVMACLGGIAAWEYFNMARKAEFSCQWRWGFLTSIGYLLLCVWILASHGRDGLEILKGCDGAVIAFVLMGAFCLQLRNQVEGTRSLTGVASSVLGFIYVAFLFSYIARLLFVPEGDSAVPGAWLIIWLVAVTKFTDMGAYITGSLIGKHKMIPHISPGKTWEGFVGALFWAQLAACALYYILPDKLAVLGGWNHVIILGFLLAILAVVGDLAESIVKRSLGAKDSGQMLPGIGGALDLIDSLCFTAPVLYFYLIWIVKTPI